MSGFYGEHLLMRPAVLEPDDETVRGVTGVPDPVEGPISLGGPAAAPLTENSLSADPDAAAFVRSLPDARFHRVELAVTFAPRDGEPIHTFWLTTKLERVAETGDAGDDPVAWTMKPDRVEDIVTKERKLSFGPQLEVLGLGFELGSSRDAKEISLEARYLRQPSPQWVLRRTGVSSISGSQLFVLVVRAPPDVDTRASVEMGAVIERRRFGLIRHRVRLPDPDAQTFALPAAR